VGKHSAADGAVVHPIVASALEQRRSDQGSPVGWPQEPRRGEGVGWPTPVVTEHVPVHPAEADDRHPDDDGSLLAALDAAAAQDAEQAAEPTPARRSGWRRLFGGGGSTSAA